MGGHRYQQNFVKKIVLETFNFMNIGWKFVQNPQNAEIRITFDPSQGVWAFLGTGCLTQPKNMPTMNLGWLDKVV
jgi:hypothetical protein